jgi:uncharacterized protein YerC
MILVKTGRCTVTRTAALGYRRTVTVPKRVSPHVKLVFAEMARQQRTYDEVEAASGVRRPTIKTVEREEQTA